MLTLKYVVNFINYNETKNAIHISYILFIWVNLFLRIFLQWTALYFRNCFCSSGWHSRNKYYQNRKL